MTPEERRQKMRAILDQHDQMAREFRESSHQAAGQVEITAQIREMSAAIDKAMTAMIEANEAALALYPADPEEDAS